MGTPQTHQTQMIKAYPEAPQPPILGEYDSESPQNWGLGASDKLISRNHLKLKQ